jgi:hypothetical protein
MDATKPGHNHQAKGPAAKSNYVAVKHNSYVMSRRNMGVHGAAAAPTADGACG